MDYPIAYLKLCGSLLQVEYVLDELILNIGINTNKAMYQTIAIMTSIFRRIKIYCVLYSESFSFPLNIFYRGYGSTAKLSKRKNHMQTRTLAVGAKTQANLWI